MEGPLDEKLLRVKELLNGKDLEGALSLALKISAPYWRDYALKWVAEEYVFLDPKKALEIAESITTESLRDDVLKDLAYLLSKNNLFKAALDAARRIKSEFHRKKALIAVSTVLAKLIVERGKAGISLSELGLDESDIEVLKPLPAGIEVKDGKLMPEGDILRIKGEFLEAVVPLNPSPRAGPPKPSIESEGSGSEYLEEYVSLLLHRSSVEELEYWSALMEGLSRNKLLEEAGLIYLKIGNLKEAERIHHELPYTMELGYRLSLKYLDSNQITKAAEFAKKIADPLKRLMVLEEFLRRGILNEDVLLEVSEPKSKYLLARILKFFAFVLLDEAIRNGNDEMRLLSKRIFDLGVKLQREFDFQMFPF